MTSASRPPRLVRWGAGLALCAGLAAHAQHSTPPTPLNLRRPLERFGADIDCHNHRLVVGTLPSKDHPDDRGRVTVFRKEEGAWEMEQVVASRRIGAHRSFGAAVAISGDTMLVGSPEELGKEEAEGAVYVFQREDDMWRRQARLTAQGKENRRGARFGAVVAIAGHTAVVGAGARDALHSAVIFEYDNGQWDAKTTLPGKLAPAWGKRARCLDMQDGLVVVALGPAPGAPGQVQTFTRVAGNWTLREILEAPAGMETTGFGTALAVEDDWLAVGAPARDATGTAACHIYQWSDDGWRPRGMLRAPGAHFGSFAQTVAINRELVVVGAPAARARGRFAGTAYVFRRNGFDWEKPLAIHADDDTGPGFGEEIVIHDDTLLFGQPRHGNGVGAVCVFHRRPKRAWARTQRLLPPPVPTAETSETP